MVDDPDAVAAPDREHFAGCADCKARFAGMDADAKTATALLATPETSFDASAAYRRMTARQQPARPRFGFRLPILRPASRGMVAALALVVLVAVGVTAAVNVSNIFQPQTVKPVPISVADLESLPKLGTYGDFKWTQQPSPAIGITKAEAEKIAKFSAPNAKASSLPSGVTSSQVTYAATAEVVGTFTFSAAKAQAAAAAQGKTLPAMPAGMDGTTLTMTIGPAILELYGDVTPPSSGTTDATQIKLPQLIIGESKAPSVTSDGVSAKELENYLLAQPGLSPELAADIKALGDPTTTLPIPVPVGYATSTDVTVQGVQGVALGDNTGVGAGVVWIKGGDVFFVGGSMKQDKAVSVANGLS